MTTPETASSTRHITVDARFAELLEEDFPRLPHATILEALEAEPCRQAIQLCQWASSKDDPKGALLAWSRKHRKGSHHPGQRRRDCGRSAPAERQERHTGRPGTNRSAPADTPAPRRSDEVGFGYGVGKATVLAGLNRMAD